MTESVQKLPAGFYVDVHAHVFPDFYAEALKEAGINDIDGWKNPAWSVESALKAMDSNNVRTQVLSMSSPGVSFLDGSELSRMARRLNEFKAGLVRYHSPRFGLLAVLPLPDIDVSQAELTYACDSLDADGFGLLSNYDGFISATPSSILSWKNSIVGSPWCLFIQLSLRVGRISR